MKRILPLLAMFVLLLLACSSKKEAEQKTTTPPPSNNTPTAKVNEDGKLVQKKQLEYQMSGIPFDLNGKPVVVGGMTFTPATQWQDFGPSKSRVAGYAYGPLKDEPDSATVLVTFTPGGGADDISRVLVTFTPGGGADDISRQQEQWFSQMALLDGRDPHTGAIQYDLQIDGMTVHMMSLFGIYIIPTAPGSYEKIEKKPYRLLAAIVEAPDGNVHLKLTGPDYTATIMIEAYMTMIKSIKKAA
jgi:hypothetical protein